KVPQKGCCLDRVGNDLEPLGYEIGAAVLTAVAIGKDHSRPRIYFVGHADGNGQSSLLVNDEIAGVRRPRREPGNMATAHGVSARVGRLRGYGNAIVPQVAAEFVTAFMDIAR